MAEDPLAEVIRDHWGKGSVALTSRVRAHIAAVLDDVLNPRPVEWGNVADEAYEAGHHAALEATRAALLGTTEEENGGG